MRKVYIISLFLMFYFLMMPISFADDIDEEIDENIEIINETIETSKNNSEEPIINSRKYVIYDRNSKRIVYGKNSNTKCAMASTTKIMTAIIVLEKADINKEVIIDSKAAGTGGSRLGLKKNDRITIRDLLYGLMLRSGNDAAIALATEVGGSTDGFANLMNEKIADLKLKNTHFVTPHGLDNPEHYTTAEELAVITDYALNNDLFREIVGTKSHTISINGISRTINNTNELLGVLDGVVGVKTGFTSGAGRCLVTEVIRGDRDLITVVLGADTKRDRTRDSIKLINYVFSNFVDIDLSKNINQAFNEWKNINSKRISINKAKEEINLDITEIKTKKLLLKQEEASKIEYVFNTIIYLEAPVEENKKIGTIVVTLNGDIIEQVDIMCKNGVEKKKWSDYIIEFCRTIMCDSA